MKHIGKIAIIAALFAGVSFAASAESVINGKKCYLVPNTGNYVTRGQIDCYTGQHVSVAGNAGNTVGTSPADRRDTDPRGTNAERRHKAAWNAFKKNTRLAIGATKNAKQALRDRDWSAFREYTRDAVHHGKIASNKFKLWQRTGQ